MSIPQILRPRADRGDPITVKRERWTAPGRGLYDMHFPVELGLVLGGVMVRTVEDVVYSVGPGQVWLQGIWEPHSAEVVEAPLELIVVHVLPESLRELTFAETRGIHWLSFWGQSPENRIGRTPARGDEVEAGFRNLAAAEGDGLRAKLQRRAHLLLLLSLLCEDFQVGEVRSERASVLAPALDAMFESKGRMGLSDAAQISGVSVSTFKRIFREHMQTGFGEFSLRYRIQGVCQELLRTRQPIKEIAETWGFVDASHLHRHFKRIIRCSPREYQLAAQPQGVS